MTQLTEEKTEVGNSAPPTEPTLFKPGIGCFAVIICFIILIFSVLGFNKIASMLL